MKKHTSRRLLALLLAAVMTASLLVGCSGGGATTAETEAAASGTAAAADSSSSGGSETSTSGGSEAAATTAAGTDGLEYNDYTSESEFTVWWASAWSWAKGAIENGWDDSIDVYQHIFEKTGTRMNIDMPSGTEEELIGVLIASGTYPDSIVFESYQSAYLQQMIDAGLVYSWSELIDQYCPKMWDLIPQSVIAQHADENGVLWYWPGFAYHETWAQEASAMGADTGGGAHGTNIIFCRQDILKAFGKDDITDLDTFTEYLHFVKDNYPDVQPLALFEDDPRFLHRIFTHFKGTFGCSLSDQYVPGDGTVKQFMYDPAYVEYLEWLNGLYRDGVITDNMLTDDDTAIETKIYSASYGAFLSATYTANNTVEESIKQMYGEDTDKLYVDVGPIQKEGVDWKCAYIRDKGSFATVITKNCEDPERVIKFFEYLLTDDGQMTINCGVEGTAWTRNDDGTIAVDPVRAEAASTDLESYNTTYAVNGNWAPWCNTSYWEGLLGQMLSPPGGPDAAVGAKRLDPYVEDFWSQGLASLEDAIPAGTDLYVTKTKVEDVAETYGMRMIAAKSEDEFDKLYQECLAEIEALGVDDMNKAYTDLYVSQCEALGIEAK